MGKKKIGVRDIIAVALMAALTFVFTYVQFQIPTPIGKTRLHLGNVMCILAAFLFGPLKGGLSAGLGSAMFDFFDPEYLPESWITFINKFMMALVAGLIYRGGKDKSKPPSFLRSVVAAVSGAMTYVVLYIAKQIVKDYLLLGVEWGTVWAGLIIKIPVSIANGVMAAIFSVLLNMAMRPALKKAGLYDNMGVR